MDVINPDKVGWLTKQGGLVKSWKKRWFVLKNSKLFYYHGKTDTTRIGEIDLEAAGIQIGDKKAGKKLCIEIITHGRTFYIHADSQNDYEEWMKALTKASLPVMSTPTLLTTGSGYFGGVSVGGSDSSASQKNLRSLMNNSTGSISDTIIVTVRGMHCDKCIAQIRYTLDHNKSITSYDIDIDKEVVTVNGKLDINELLASIEQHGFIAILTL